MPDDNERKVVKKKVVKKLVKKPVGEGDAQTKRDDDALAAFGIKEPQVVSKAKLATPVAKPTAPPPVAEGGPKKIVAKKVVKKLVKRPEGETPPQVTAKPAVAKVPDEDDDGFVVEPIKERDNEPNLAPTTGQTDDGKRSGGLRELLSTKKPPETKPAPTEGSSEDDDKPQTKDTSLGTEDIDEFDRANGLLDDIDLDKITKNIQEDLLETFEEKIDDILVDIIEDEDAVEELTRTDTEKGSAPGKGFDDEELDKLLKDSEKGVAIKPPPKPAVKPAVTKLAPTVVSPKPAVSKPEVTKRPEVQIDVDVAPLKKDVVSDEPVTMEKTEVKVIADDAISPKRDDTKAVTKGSDTSDDAIRIEEGDVRERRVAYKVAHNFDKLPPNMRNELLRNLAKVGDPKVREDVVVAIATHFKTLPADVQGIMTNLARDENTRVREEVVFEIQSNFSNISTVIRERILKALVMDKEPSVREEVVSTICQHYNDLSTDVRDLLKTLAKDKIRSVREELSFEMQKSDSPVPKAVRDEVLGMLKGQR